MINEHSLRAVERAHFDIDLCRPLYESYGFSRIPATIRTYLTGQDHERALPRDVGGFDAKSEFVILFFLDGFGWRFFEQYLPEAPFLQRFVNSGIASKLTSQFPSTTTGHVTCMNTGLEVGQSGLYEWFLYEPTLDRVISPLLCSYAGDKTPGTLEKAGVFSPSIYPAKTIYEDFRQLGIHSFALQPASIAHSPYSRAMLRGATYLPYHNIAEGIDKAVELYNARPRGEKHYVYFYICDFDATAHRHGLSSPDCHKVATEMLRLLEERFLGGLAISSEATLTCLVTADHGMIEVSPDNTFYINRELPGFERYIVRNARGELVIPAGSCRDLFLHIRPEFIDEAKRELEAWLGSRALIVKTEELVARGFFGSEPPSALFKQRVGNLVVLPREHYAIWWYEKDRFEQKFYAMHGGLSRSEMEIPFLYLKC